MAKDSIFSCIFKKSFYSLRRHFLVCLVTQQSSISNKECQQFIIPHEFLNNIQQADDSGSNFFFLDFLSLGRSFFQTFLCLSFDFFSLFSFIESVSHADELAIFGGRNMSYHFLRFFTMSPIFSPFPSSITFTQAVLLEILLCFLSPFICSGIESIEDAALSDGGGGNIFLFTSVSSDFGCVMNLLELVILLR